MLSVPPPFKCTGRSLSAWKSFCFSATRFSTRFRAVELKERISAWEAWGEAGAGQSTWGVSRGASGGVKGTDGPMTRKLPKGKTRVASTRGRVDCQKGSEGDSRLKGLIGGYGDLTGVRASQRLATAARSWKRSGPDRGSVP